MGDFSSYYNATIPNYELFLENVFPWENLFLGRLRKNQTTFKTGSNKYVFAGQFSRNEGNAWAGPTGTSNTTADAATLPTPTDADIEQITVDTQLGFINTFIYPAAEANFANGKAFVKDLFKFKMQDAMDTALFRFEQTVLGSGNGVLATVNGDPGTGTTVVVANPYGKTASGGELSANPAELLFAANMYIDFIDPNTGNARSNTPAGGYLVTNVDPDTLTLTLGHAIDATVADADYIVRYGEYNNVPEGLMSLVANASTGAATFQGITIASYPRYVATRVHNNGNLQPLSETLLQQLFTTTRLKTGLKPAKNYRLFANPQIIDAAARMIFARQRFSEGEATAGSKAPAFEWNGTTFEYDDSISAAPNRVWLLDWDDIGLLEKKPLSWFQLNGSYLLPVGSSVTSPLLMRSVAYWMMNPYVRDRRRHGTLEDVAA